MPDLNISTIFGDFGDFPSALKYAKESIPWSERLDFPAKENSKAAIYTGMQELYLKNNEVDSARYYMQLALENCTKIAHLDNTFHQDQRMATHFSAAKFYIQQKEFESALMQLDSAKVVSYDPQLTEIAFFEYHLAVGNLTEATRIFQGIEDFEMLPLDLNYFLKLKAKYYKATNNFEKAFEIQEELNKTEKEIAQQNSLNYSKYVNLKLANFEKEEEVQILEKDKSISLSKNKQLSWILAFATSLLLLAFFLFRQIREKNRLLTEDLANKKLIEEQATALQKTNDLKNQLFINVSHELRTPLTLIGGPVELLLQKKNIDANDRQQLQMVKRNSDELLQLTNQILDLTKSEFGAVKTAVSAFHFHDLLSFLYPSFQNLAKNKDIQLTFPEKVDNDIVLLSDAEKLQTILKNLLVNALKYSSVKKEVSLTYTNLGKDLKIQIKDSGQGIAKEDLPYIFDRYYQSTINKTFEGGVGIGLAICKEYIQLLGGTIAVESTEGQGSIFTIQFPKELHRLAGQVQRYEFPSQDLSNLDIPAKLNISDAESEKLHLLIVEDNLDLCEFLNHILKEDYNLSFAHNGKKALEQIKIESPTLIVTDWMMPEMDGHQLLKELKSSDVFHQIPVIMLTARDDMNDKLKALRTGVDDYLIKPFVKEELTNRITNLLKNSTARKAYVETLKEGHHAVTDTKDFMPNAGLSKESELWLEELKDAVRNNISNTNLTVEMVATQLFISRPQFFRRVKSLTGITPMNFIQQVRFEEARYLLEQRKFLTVKAVAHAVGFKSAKTFSMNFKRRFGRLPSEYME